MSAFASLVTIRKWDRDREFLPWVIVVACVTMAFFIGMNVFFENPFAQLYQTFDGVAAHTLQPANSILFTPEDGRGLNPLLRHPGMVIHPPMLYLGFVSLSSHTPLRLRHDHRRTDDRDPPDPPLDIMPVSVRLGQALGI
jgi:cytochrome c-type biogenesis protein CcmF